MALFLLCYYNILLHEYEASYASAIDYAHTHFPDDDLNNTNRFLIQCIVDTKERINSQRHLPLREHLPESHSPA